MDPSTPFLYFLTSTMILQLSFFTMTALKGGRLLLRRSHRRDQGIRVCLTKGSPSEDSSSLGPGRGAAVAVAALGEFSLGPARGRAVSFPWPCRASARRPAESLVVHVSVAEAASQAALTGGRPLPLFCCRTSGLFCFISMARTRLFFYIYLRH